MNFEALMVFVAVVEHRGFNSAAKALFKTQPAITMIIKKLETQTGLILFDRNSYRPTLTSDGEKLFQRAKALVKHWQNTHQFANQLKAKIESDITIAIDVFFPLSALRTLLNNWINRYTQTRFHFLSESLGGACERLIQHQADLIISENLMTHQAVEILFLRTEWMVPVASPFFIEQFSEKLENLDTLSQCMQVILQDSSQSNFTFGVIENARHWTVSDIIAKKEIILSGLGWGRLPLHLISEELQNGQLMLLKGSHFDSRFINLNAIRIQKPAHGPIANLLWDDLKLLQIQSTSSP